MSVLGTTLAPWMILTARWPKNIEISRERKSVRFPPKIVFGNVTGLEVGLHNMETHYTRSVETKNACLIMLKIVRHIA